MSYRDAGRDDDDATVVVWLHLFFLDPTGACLGRWWRIVDETATHWDVDDGKFMRLHQVGKALYERALYGYAKVEI